MRRTHAEVREKKRIFYFLVILVLAGPPARAQSFLAAQPAAKEHKAFLAVPRGLAQELAASSRDFVTFRDVQWETLTLAQIGAGAADADTSLYNLDHCASCQETGLSRFVVGERPDAHKYIVAGLIEISVEAVLGHYLRNRLPARKWYGRVFWALPQSLSLFAHARASLYNAGVNLNCPPAGPPCY